MSYLISGTGKKSGTIVEGFIVQANIEFCPCTYIKKCMLVNKRTLPLSKQNMVCISSRNKLGMYELLYSIHKHAKQMSAVQTKLTKFMVHVELLEL